MSEEAPTENKDDNGDGKGMGDDDGVVNMKANVMVQNYILFNESFRIKFRLFL